MGRAQDAEKEGQVLDWGSAWGCPEAFSRVNHLSEPTASSWNTKMAIMSPSEAFARKKGGGLRKHQF